MEGKSLAAAEERSSSDSLLLHYSLDDQPRHPRSGKLCQVCICDASVRHHF